MKNNLKPIAQFTLDDVQFEVIKTCRKVLSSRRNMEKVTKKTDLIMNQIPSEDTEARQRIIYLRSRTKKKLTECWRLLAELDNSIAKMLREGE